MHRSSPVLALALALAPCAHPALPEARTFAFARAAFGVSFQIVLVGQEPATLAPLAEDCFAELARLERVLGNWTEGSSIRRLNASADAGRTPLEPELARVLLRATAFCQQSGGAFDVTVGALLEALGFYSGEGRSPDPERWAELRARTGCGRFAVHGDGEHTPYELERALPGLVLDLAGVAKGWAVARVVERLRAAGVHDAFVAAGASAVYALGHEPGQRGWSFEVPSHAGTRATWWLCDEAVATSAQLSQPFLVDGRLTSHVIDPRSGRPVEHGTLVSVFRGPDPVEADMASTALLVLGEREAPAWFDAQPLWPATRRAELVLVAGPADEHARILALGAAAER